MTPWVRADDLFAKMRPPRLPLRESPLGSCHRDGTFRICSNSAKMQYCFNTSTSQYSRTSTECQEVPHVRNSGMEPPTCNRIERSQVPCNMGRQAADPSGHKRTAGDIGTCDRSLRFTRVDPIFVSGRIHDNACPASCQCWAATCSKTIAGRTQCAGNHKPQGVRLKERAAIAAMMQSVEGYRNE